MSDTHGVVARGFWYLLPVLALTGCGGCEGDPCDPNLCTQSNRTVCTNNNGTAICACDEGYIDNGSGECVTAPSCSGNTCSGHGTCAIANGTASCTCTAGFSGASCDTCAAGHHDDGSGGCALDQSCLPSTCSSHGTCTATGGEVACACQTGYRNTYCQDCASSYHRASSGACVSDESCQGNDCSGNGTCAVTSGVAACTCSAGYAGDDCSLCDAGYHRGASNSCVVDETCQGNTCSSHGSCALASGLARCTCEDGYTGTLCQSCAAGYHDASGSCVLDQTCLATTCSGHGTCARSSGVVSCTVCNTGYTGTWCELCNTGFHRLADGSCAANETCQGNNCSGHGNCALVNGLAVCTCSGGYSGVACAACAAGHHVDNNACVLDQTCLGTTCSGHATCSLVNGLVTCGTCDDGYTGTWCQLCDTDFHRNPTSGLCVADESCSGMDCSGHGNCGLVGGLAVCACGTGYADVDCEVCATGFHRDAIGACVVDESCDGVDCTGHGTCAVEGGFALCGCVDGYAGPACDQCYPGYQINQTSGLCEVPCNYPGEIRCWGRCVNGVTSDNCGGCGLACTGDSVCSQNRQGPPSCVCPVDLLYDANCNGECTSLAYDEANCGACGNGCNAGEKCIEGRCIVEGTGCGIPPSRPCDDRSACCDGRCSDLSAFMFDDLNCGGCDIACDNVACVNGTCYGGNATDCVACAPNTQVCCSDPLGGPSQCLFNWNLSNDTNNCGTCGNVCGPGEQCSQGVCRCPSDWGDPYFARCDGVCSYLAENQNCGACGNACSGPAQCVAGPTGNSCFCPVHPMVDPTCNNQCTDLGYDEANCGTCGHACNTGERCMVERCMVEDASSCPAGCADWELCCNGSCLSAEAIWWDANNCGGCGVVCDPGLACVNGACYAGNSTDCNCLDPANEVCCAGVDPNPAHCVTSWSFTVDPLNCGACGHACGVNEQCFIDQCQCPSDFHDPAWDRCTGECTNLMTNENCGACGNACSAAETCNNGQCACPSDWGDTSFARCNGVCTNLMLPANCGGCGHACAPGDQCNWWMAECFCPADQNDPSWTRCNGVCTNLTLPETCGACDNACVDQACVAQRCYGGDSDQCTGCDTATQVCCSTSTDPVCVGAAQLSVDRYNCGACNNVCGLNEQCNNGQCQCPADSTWDLCDGACTSLPFNNDNCGRCGNVCDQGAGIVCIQGNCIPDPCNGVLAVGECDGNIMRYCMGSGIVEVDCSYEMGPGKVCGLVDCFDRPFPECFGWWCVSDVGQSCDPNLSPDMHCDASTGVTCVNGICSEPCDQSYVPSCAGNVWNFCDNGMVGRIDCARQQPNYICELPPDELTPPCVGGDSAFCGDNQFPCASGFNCVDLFCTWTPGILEARAAADGTGLDLPISRVVVTYVKPAVGADPAGFFVQAMADGPALFVQVDPGMVVAQHVVSFDIDTLTTINGMRVVTAISNLVIHSMVPDLSVYVQDVTWVRDLVSAIDSYESEYKHTTVTLTGGFVADGADYVVAPVDTMAVVDDSNLQLRVPAALYASGVAQHYNIEPGCVLNDLAPLWRTDAVAQVAAWTERDLAVSTCPAPRVVSAIATSPTTVVVTFSRAIQDMSVSPDGFQFMFNAGLTATGAAKGAETNEIAVDTEGQNPGFSYRVMVDPSVFDVFGASIDPAHDSAQFTGFEP